MLMTIRTKEPNAMHIRHKLFYKLFFSLILISVLPLLLVGWLNYNHSSESLNKELDQNAASTLEQKSQIINVFISDLNRIAQLISSNRAVSDFLTNRDPEKKYYQFFLKLDPIVANFQSIRFENVGITLISDKNLVYYYGYSFDREKASFQSYTWLSELSGMGNLSYISQVHDRPYAMNDNNQPVFSYVQRIWSQMLNAQGTLIIDFPITVLDNLFANAIDEKNSGTLIFDQQGNLLFPRSKSILPKTYLEQVDPTVELQTIQIPSGDVYRLFKQEEHYTDWEIISYFKQKDLYAAIYTDRRFIILILTITTLICLFASLIFSHRISKPIKALAKAMKKVETGDLQQRLTIISRDEIGQLGLGFNRMIRHIQELIDRVYYEQKEKRSAEITALQAQINPHFLYNTLESINSLARNNNQKEISKRIVLLGKLLRFSISTTEEFVLIEKEMMFVTQYLQIHKLKKRESQFSYNIQVDEKLLQLYTIKWILQPIVENAIIHGLDPKMDGGSIEITGGECGEDFFFLIKDNGVGIPEKQLRKIVYQLKYESEHLTKHENKIGLHNVQSRIQLHYGSPYGIRVDSVYGQGTSVSILLPRRAGKHE